MKPYNALKNIPQISPMNWLLLMAMFFFLFYLTLVKTYYLK